MFSRRSSSPLQDAGACADEIARRIANRIRLMQLQPHPAAIREMQREGQLRHSCRQHRTRRYSNNRIESDHRHIKRRLRSMYGPRSLATACAVLAGIEAVQMIRKGQVLGITKKNLHGQAWVFSNLLGSTSLNRTTRLSTFLFNAVATLLCCSDKRVNIIATAR